MITLEDVRALIAQMEATLAGLRRLEADLEGSERFRCDECGKPFLSAGGLASHKMSHEHARRMEAYRQRRQRPAVQADPA